MSRLRKLCPESVSAGTCEKTHVPENACEKPLKKTKSRKHLKEASETPVETPSTGKKKPKTTAPEEDLSETVTEKKKKNKRKQEEDQVEQPERVDDKKRKKCRAAETAETSSPPEETHAVDEAKDDAIPAPPKAWL